MSLVVRVAQVVAALALGLSVTAPCQAAPQEDWSRNPRGFELGIQQQDTGDSWGVTLRACRGRPAHSAISTQFLPRALAR